MVRLRFSAHEQPVDQLFIAYVDWSAAFLRLKESYRTWTTRAGEARTAHQFGQCVAALDAEERAADAYARVARRSERRRTSTTAPR